MDSIALLAKRCIEIKTARQLGPAVADRLQSLSKQLEESLYSPSLSEKLEKKADHREGSFRTGRASRAPTDTAQTRRAGWPGEEDAAALLQ